MSDAHASPGPSAAMGIGAALLWATYYFFVLAMTPGTAPSALITYPFLLGGGTYVAWAVYWGHGRIVLQLFRSGAAWTRVGFIVLMQFSVLASTYLAGPVDTSLLTLVGDAAMTPLLAMLVLREGRHRARSLPFVGGLVLAGVGASLTIAAGGGAAPFAGRALLVAPFVPLSIAVFYILSARESQRLPSSALVGQSTIAGGIVCVVLAGVVPGGWPGLLLTSPVQVLLMFGVALSSFFVAPVLYFRAVTRSGIVLPALFQVLIPVFALILAILLLHQIPAAIGLAGIPVAVIGGLFAFRGAQTPAPPTSAEEALLTEGGALAPDAPGDPSGGPAGELRQTR